MYFISHSNTSRSHCTVISMSSEGSSSQSLLSKYFISVRRTSFFTNIIFLKVLTVILNMNYHTFFSWSEVFFDLFRRFVSFYGHRAGRLYSCVIYFWVLLAACWLRSNGLPRQWFLLSDPCSEITLRNWIFHCKWSAFRFPSWIHRGLWDTPNASPVDCKVVLWNS